MHRVALPVAEAATTLGDFGPPGNGCRVAEFSAVFPAAARFSVATQIPRPLLASQRLRVDPCVDRLPRYLALAVVGKQQLAPTGDLVRRPILLQVLAHHAIDLGLVHLPHQASVPAPLR